MPSKGGGIQLLKEYTRQAKAKKHKTEHIKLSYPILLANSRISRLVISVCPLKTKPSIINLLQ